MRRFDERFQRYGMDKGVVSPSYGLAENCVGLCFPPAGRGPKIDRIKRESLASRGYAEPAGPEDTDAIEMVACGHPIEKNDVRIVDDGGHEVGERHEGMLEFRGPSMTKGYFRNEAKTRELFHDGWIKSGDRAYIAGGDIHITGRVKDIIIRAGRNTYPQEIEEGVSAIPGIRKGGVAAFGSPDPQNGTERLIVMAETKETNPEARAKLIAAAHEVVTAIAGAAADDIVLVPPRGVPKTSSGKVRRSSAKELYETGRTDVKQSGVWWQIARLAFSSAGRTVTNLMRRIGDMLYAGWWYLVTALALVAAYIATMILPSALRTLGGAADNRALGACAHRHSRGRDRRRAAAARQRRHPVQSHELHGRGHHRVGAAGRAGVRRQEGIRRPALRGKLHAPARRRRSSSASTRPRASRMPRP